MRAKYLIPFLVFVLVLCLFLGSCEDESRVEELEQRVVELQKELAVQEEPKAEAEDTVKEETGEDKIIEVITQYIDAVEEQNFVEQRKYVDKYALDLVVFKEEEFRKRTSSIERSVSRQLPKVLSIANNKAEAFMSFTENLESYDYEGYSLITEGKVYLERLEGEWKITDYTRKNRLISKALYVFKEDTIETTKSDIEIELRRVLFSIYDKSVTVSLKVTNNTDEPLWIATHDSAVIGLDRIQNSYIWEDKAFGNILPNAAVVGDIGFNWNSNTPSDFEFYSGHFIDTDGYEFCDSLFLLVELEKAVRY